MDPDPKRSNRIEQFYNQALEWKPPEASLFLPRLAWPKASIAEKSSLPSRSAIIGTTFHGDHHRHTSRVRADYGTPGPRGNGEVYRARDTKLKRDVAIKILPEEFSRDPDRVSRFQREAEVLASLDYVSYCTPVNEVC